MATRDELRAIIEGIKAKRAQEAGAAAEDLEFFEEERKAMEKLDLKPRCIEEAALWYKLIELCQDNVSYKQRLKENG